MCSSDLEKICSGALLVMVLENGQVATFRLTIFGMRAWAMMEPYQEDFFEQVAPAIITNGQTSSTRPGTPRLAR